MKPKEHFTFDELNAVLRHEDGHLFWRENRVKVRAGDKAGVIDSTGRRAVVFRGKNLLNIASFGFWFVGHGQS